MAIDYIIGAFQLLSAAVNVLALTSFWITPGLRTTSNRFVINLLIVNVVGCLALTPALWLHGGLVPPIYNGSRIITDESNEFRASFHKLTKNYLNSSVAVEPIMPHQMVEENGPYNSKTHQNDQETLLNRTYQVNATWPPTKNILYSDCTRFWGFDLVAALGGLSVMLVVGDTWCAITDPLRYHSKVSGLKSWILIAISWFVSIVFCIASALRRDCHLITSEITSTLRKINWGSMADDLPTESESPIVVTTSRANASVDDIYDLGYSCTFFVVIILAPICLVCAMYWKIFSEARQNSLRMRQNGSSAQLQSALNLATVSAQLTAQALHERSCSIIGEEESDIAESLSSSNSNGIQITLRRNSMIADASPNQSVKIYEQNFKQTPTKLHSSADKTNTLGQQRRYLEISKSDEIHSYSSYQSVFRKDCLDDSKCKEITSASQLNTCSKLRQVHSTSDIQTLNSEVVLLSNGNRISVKLPAKKENHSTRSIDKHADTMVAIAIRSPSICEAPKAHSYMTSIRHRLSNASSIFKYREESRAARISILVVIMFLFSYFPYGLLVMLQGRITFYANSSFLAVLFLLIANISSPFIFAYRNRRVRRGVCRLFGADAKTNDRLQKQRIHSNSRANSCRGRKRKTKIVRINRKSARSASFSSDAHIQCKYTPVPLFDKSDSETQTKCEDSAIGATNAHRNIHVSPSCQLATECQTFAAASELHINGKVGHHGNGDLTAESHIDDIMLNRSSNQINEIKQGQSESIYFKDCAGSVLIANQNRMGTTVSNNVKSSNNSLSKTINRNINRTNSNNCNFTTTSGASVIKQKISLLRCVCMNSVLKNSAPNSAICISSYRQPVYV